MAKTRARASVTARRYQTLELLDLSGGIDRRRSPTLLAKDRSVELLNFSLTNPGELVVRAGYRQFSTTNLGNTRIQGGVRFYLGSTQGTLIAHNSSVYRLDDSGGFNSTAVYSTLASTAQVYFPFDRSMVALFDGVNRPRKSTDGVTFTRMGIDAGTVRSTASSVSSGSLSASEFEFSYTYKDRGLAHESNECTLVSTLTMGATGGASLQIPNSSDAQVDAIVVYARNKTAGETVRRKATSGAMSGGASSTLVVSSSDWSASEEAPTNHDVPAAYQFAVIWKNRWWAVSPTVGNRLHFTELFQPQSWPALYYIDLPFERGDAITALQPLGDTLLVFGQSGPYLIIGQTSLDFEVRPSAGTQAGALGPRCVAAIENGIIHVAAEGVFIFDGASDRYLSADIETPWREMVRTAAPADLARIAVVYHFPFKELRVAVPRREPTGVAGEWVLDLNRTRETERPAWTSTDRTIGGYLLFDGHEPTTGHRGRLLSWHSSTQGTVWKESTGTSANSSNLTATAEGPHLPTGYHRARLIDVRGEYEPHAGTFAIEPFVDGISQGSQSIPIGAALAVYGTATYGTATYAGAGRMMFHVTQPLGAEGRSLWLKTTYVGQESFRFFSYALGLVPESRPRGFSD